MKNLNVICNIANVVVGIAGIFSSIYCGIKCAKISKQQMDELSEETSNKVLRKIVEAASGTTSSEENGEKENNDD